MVINRTNENRLAAATTTPARLSQLRNTPKRIDGLGDGLVLINQKVPGLDFPPCFGFRYSDFGLMFRPCRPYGPSSRTELCLLCLKGPHVGDQRLYLGVGDILGR